MIRIDAQFDPSDVPPSSIDGAYLIEPDYVKIRGWSLYYFDDELTYEQLQSLVPESSLSAGVYIKCTYGDKHETTRFTGEFEEFWDFISGINSDRCCMFDRPNNFLLTVLYADVSIIATDRKLMQDIFGASDTTRDEWIKETRHFKPDLRAEIRAKYVRDA